MKSSIAKKILAYLIATIIIVGLAVGIYFIINIPKGNETPSEKTKTINFTVSDSTYYSNIFISINDGEKTQVREGDSFSLDLNVGDKVTFFATCIASRTQTQTAIGANPTTITFNHGFKIANKTMTNFKNTPTEISISFNISEDVDSYKMEEYQSSLSLNQNNAIR